MRRKGNTVDTDTLEMYLSLTDEHRASFNEYLLALSGSEDSPWPSLFEHH